LPCAATFVREAAAFFACLVALIMVAGCPVQVKSGTLVGLVKDEAGTPVAAAVIVTLPATAQTTTDSLGAFVLDFVPAGAYLVKADCPGLLPDSAPTSVTTGDTASVNLTLRTARRRVAAEMISTVCLCSRPERASIYALMDSLGDSLVYVEYHASGDTLAEYWEPLLCPASEARRLLYAPTFLIGAWLYLDGRTELVTAGLYRQKFDSLARIASPVAVTLAGTRNGDSTVTATVDLRAVEGFGPNVGVGIGLYEGGPISYENSPGDTSWLRNVVLDLKFQDTIGMAAGETRTIHRTLTIPDTLSPKFPPLHVVNKSDVGVYVIIQDLVTRQVLQAAQMHP
jgi:hypothetical protein